MTAARNARAALARMDGKPITAWTEDERRLVRALRALINVSEAQRRALPPRGSEHQPRP